MGNTENLLVQVKVDHHQLVGDLRVEGDVYKRQLVERAEMRQFLRSQRGVAHPIQREDHRPRFFPLQKFHKVPDRVILRGLSVCSAHRIDVYKRQWQDHAIQHRRRTVIKGRGRSGVHRYLTTLFEKDAVTGQR